MSSVSDMLSDLGWRDLNQRRVDGRLCIAYKIVHGLVVIPIGQFIKLQSDGVHLHIIYAKPKYYLYSFFPRTVSDWNCDIMHSHLAPSVFCIMYSCCMSPWHV